jgi:hypothetical protein
MLMTSKHLASVDDGERVRSIQRLREAIAQRNRLRKDSDDRSSAAEATRIRRSADDDGSATPPEGGAT